MSTFPKISAIIVAINEELLISQIIGELKKQNYPGEIEIILADGGSVDKTIERAKEKNIRISISSNKGKAIQMNSASRIATGDILFFVHADMTFSDNIFSSIYHHIEKGFAGGGFSNVFDEHNEKIKSLGNWMNIRIFNRKEQSDRGLFYGDNGIFVKKGVFDSLGGFKEIPIMEDYDFSKRLREKYTSVKIKEPHIIVSARRHIKSGFLKTRLQWVLIKKLYTWGISPFSLAKWYQDMR